ncbi:MAG: ATP-dependent zinc metalloprotease FtsH [Acidimicrobiia bacterium]|nr:ATP-dependent zinc metalloprotease FtsH [Acidimicrobiia bacterium]
MSQQPPRSSGDRPGAGPGGPGEPNRSDAGWPRWAVWLVAVLFLSIIAFAMLNRPTSSNQVDTSEFITKLDQGQVQDVTVEGSGQQGATGTATGTYRDGTQFSTTVVMGDDLSERLQTANRDHQTTYQLKAPENNILGSVLFFLLPFALLILLMWWINRRAQGQMGSIMQIGKSKAKVYTTEKPKTTFNDVAGHRSPKEEIEEVVTFLKEPRKFKELGAKVPKGVLLVGPPGTGKTLLARAVAGEAGVPFIAVTGSDFMEMFVGVGASRVRDLFQTARKESPAVIFIDEIDSIGRKRGAGVGGGHDEREQTLNQLLSEMDGFEGSDGIVIMAATNRPDILDPALLRAGRFDRQIVVPLPTKDERLSILEVHTRDKKLAADVDLDVTARGTPGFSGADLANLTNEAALHAVRKGHRQITRDDFDTARDRVLMGVRRDSLAMSEEEKRITAFHEAGHALCGALTEHADEVHKVTILPVGMALGVTQFLPEERQIESLHNIEADLVVALGGRVAEEIVFRTPSTGAQNDLQQATKLARKMVKEWGMSEKLGPVAFGGDSDMVFLGDEIARGHEYSEETARLIDEEVSRIVGDARRRATHLLTENRAALDMLSQALLERESIEGKDVDRIIETARNGGHLSQVFPPEPEPEPATAPQGDRVPASDAAATANKPGIVPPMAPGVSPA